MNATILPDIPRILTAFAEWIACLYVIARCQKRIEGIRYYLLAAVMLIFQAAFLVATDGADGIWWLVCMGIAILGMGFFIALSSEGSLYTVGFRCAESFTLAEFLASLEWLLQCFFQYYVGMDHWTSFVLGMGLSYGIIFAYIYIWGKISERKVQEMDISLRELLTVATIVALVFAGSNIGFLVQGTPFSGQYSHDIFQIRTLIDAIGLVGVYAYKSILQNQRAVQDLVKMGAILETQYQQYQKSKEAQGLINYKYHDLKQYITVMRQGNDNSYGEKILDKIEEEISDYETQNKTGNAVLDTILTAKSIVCRQNHINLTSVVDGSMLDFMGTMDICSVFGNALDNAIEYEIKHVDEEKRMIHLMVVKQKNAFLVIRVENYCEEIMDLDDKLPDTTKADTSLHGYGLRSIQQVVHKYGGEMLLDSDGNWFQLKILIPVQND